MEKLTTAEGISFLAMVFLWLCCWTYALPNATSTVRSKDTDHQFIRWLRGTWSCENAFDHCSSPPNDKANDTRPRPTGKLVPAVPREKLDFEDYRRIRCYCDPQCRMYGDCCPDAVDTIEWQFANGTQQEVQEENPLSALWECQHLPLKDISTRDIYVIGSCPNEYPHTGIQMRCNRSIAEDHYDYYLDIPVISTQSNLTYANIYCAVCHNDSQVHNWSIIIECPETIHNCSYNLTLWKYYPRQGVWYYNNTDKIKYEITIKDVNATHIHDYQTMFKAQKCRRGVVDSCPPSWTGVRERHLCAAYTLYVKLPKSDMVYKNEHCAKCNQKSVLEQQFECPPDFLEPPLHGGPFDPYSITIDMLFENMSNSLPCGPSGEIQCKPGEFCDPLKHICHAYNCGDNFDIDPSGEHCVINTQLSTVMHPCVMEYIHQDDFVWQHNGTIYVNSTGRTYSFNEYEVLNETTITACIDLNDIYTGTFPTPEVIISIVCISSSLLGLIVHIIVHLLLPQLRNLPGKNLLCLSSCIFIGQILFQFGAKTSRSHYKLCVIIAVIIHYSFLASFFWMNVMAIDVFRTFVWQENQPCRNRKFWKYGVYAWLIPFLIVMLAIFNNVFHFMPQIDPMYGEDLCWITNPWALILFFAAPLALLLLENFILFALIVASIHRTSKMAKIAQKSSSNCDRTRFFLYTKLVIVMGLTWVFGIAVAFANSEPLQYLFIILNGSQGVFIFLAFTCKWKVYDMLKVRFLLPT